MNIWTLILFGLKQTPERALEILKSLRPSQWQFYVDGQKFAAKYDFDVIGSAKTRMLVVDISYRDANGNDQAIHVATRFKNDGSDSLSINSVAQVGCDFKFHSKPLRREFVVELNYKVADSTQNLQNHVVELRNE